MYYDQPLYPSHNKEGSSTKFLFHKTFNWYPKKILHNVLHLVSEQINLMCNALSQPSPLTFLYWLIFWQFALYWNWFWSKLCQVYSKPTLVKEAKVSSKSYLGTKQFQLSTYIDGGTNTWCNKRKQKGGDGKGGEGLGNIMKNPLGIWECHWEHIWNRLGTWWEYKNLKITSSYP